MACECDTGAAVPPPSPSLSPSPSPSLPLPRLPSPRNLLERVLGAHIPVPVFAHLRIPDAAEVRAAAPGLADAVAAFPWPLDALTYPPGEPEPRPLTAYTLGGRVLQRGGDSGAARWAAAFPVATAAAVFLETWQKLWVQPACTATVLLGPGVCTDLLAALPPTHRQLVMARCYWVSSAVRFAHLPALTALNCAETAVSNASIASLPPCLRELRVVQCMWLTSDVSFAHLPALTTLECTYTAVGDAAVATLRPSLCELDVEECRGITSAVSFAHLPALTALDCSYTAVGDDAVATLHPCLQALRAVGCRAITGWCGTEVPALAHLPALTRVGGMHWRIASPPLRTHSCHVDPSH